jgi:hypothetical protein
MPNFPSAGKSIFLGGEIYLSRQEHSSTLSEPPVGKILFIVQGDLYSGLESPWDFLCSTHPEEQPMAVDPELKAEFDAWDAASDEASDRLSGPETQGVSGP